MSLAASLPVLLAIFAGANVWIVLIAYAILVGSIFKLGFETIKPNAVGVVLFFGKRTDTTLSEGLNWIIPIIETVQEISLAPITYDVGKDGKFQVDAISGKDAAGNTTMLQMTVAYMAVIKVDKCHADLTMNISSKELEDIVVQMTKQAVRHLGSISSYQDLMADLGKTETDLRSSLSDLDTELRKYGYVRERFTLSKMTPTDEGFKRAAEGQAREEKERQSEKTQQAHIREMVLAEVEASKGPDGKPTLSYKEAMEQVQVIMGKAKCIVVTGSGADKVLLSDVTLK